MEKLRPFQIGLLIAFGLIAVASVFVLASFKGFSVSAVNPYGDRVVIWGTLDEEPFRKLFQELSREEKDFQVVEYVRRDPRSFESDLINAIADGRAPHAIVLSHEDLVSLRTKIQPISYDTFSERSLRDNYVDGADIFALNNGLYAIPFLVDPLLMYWNRDLFSTAGLALPPATWEQLTDVTTEVTLRDATRNIMQAAVAFGEHQNVNNFKEVLLTLLLQTGSRLVEEGTTRYTVAIDRKVGDDSNRPLTTTLQFFTEFSNPSSPLYSWNRTFQSDTSAFLSEKLAIYFGYGSEAGRLRDQNPNFNFDVANVPQGAGATVKRVYGKFYGLAIIKASDNPQGAYRAALKIAETASAARLAEALAMAPAQRSTLAAGSGDPIRQTIFAQTLIARGWLDPGAADSRGVFSAAIDDINSGKQKATAAAADLTKRLELAF